MESRPVAELASDCDNCLTNHCDYPLLYTLFKVSYYYCMTASAYDLPLTVTLAADDALPIELEIRQVYCAESAV